MTGGKVSPNHSVHTTRALVAFSMLAATIGMISAWGWLQAAQVILWYRKGFAVGHPPWPDFMNDHWLAFFTTLTLFFAGTAILLAMKSHRIYHSRGTGGQGTGGQPVNLESSLRIPHPDLLAGSENIRAYTLLHPKTG